MWHVDDGTLHAYLDGEPVAFDGRRGFELEAHLATCADCAARLDRARRLRDAAHAILHSAGPEPGDPPPFEDLVRRARGAARRPARPPRRATRIVSWAASIAIALGIGWYARATLTTGASGSAAPPQAAAAVAPGRSAGERALAPAADAARSASTRRFSTGNDDAATRRQGATRPDAATRLAAADSGARADSGDTDGPAAGNPQVPAAADARLALRGLPLAERAAAGVASAREEAKPRGAVRPDTTATPSGGPDLSLPAPPVRIARSIRAPADAPTPEPVAARVGPLIAARALARGEPRPDAAVEPGVAELEPRAARAPVPLTRPRAPGGAERPPLAGAPRPRRGFGAGHDRPDPAPTTSPEKDDPALPGILSGFVAAVANAVSGRAPSSGELAAPAPRRVRGHVLEAGNGAALVGTRVLLIGRDGDPVRSAITDLDGYFEFRDVPPGRYHLAAERDGYEMPLRTIHVEAKSDVVVDLRMRVVRP
ncbi:MAG TPA: carboxypeptidase regulatory-like domain-containing protein [Longimicrobiales bacterium]